MTCTVRRGVGQRALGNDANSTMGLRERHDPQHFVIGSHVESMTCAPKGSDTRHDVHPHDAHVKLPSLMLLYASSMSEKHDSIFGSHLHSPSKMGGQHLLTIS